MNSIKYCFNKAINLTGQEVLHYIGIINLTINSPDIDVNFSTNKKEILF